MFEKGQKVVVRNLIANHNYGGRDAYWFMLAMNGKTFTVEDITHEDGFETEYRMEEVEANGYWFTESMLDAA